MQGNNDPELQGLLIQDAVNVQGQPPKVREQFVRKVIVLVCLQLVIAFGFASPMIFDWHPVLEATPCKAAIRVVNVIAVVVLVIQFIHFNIAGGRMEYCRRQYMQMLIVAPWNFIWMLVYALLSGVFLGFCTWMVAPRTVWILAICYLSAVAILSVFAIYTSFDFSTWNLTKFLIGTIVATCFIFGFHCPKVLERILDWTWVVFFLSFLVQHTQLVFGTARPKEQSLQYTIDMYGYASYVLYCVYINGYVCLLRALQVETWPDALTGKLCSGGTA
uniref:Uncharacterized protein n=1 Tax=Alexandrium andersonii TaxID=327968 RepID=A0A7S2DQ58_9DINO|mmetsp:Transcript_57563/g.129436  ORF Transcript_57563/g.129436 Transcript_57563/m.129436 type:complete len:275 (+) Transcript_57563:98-922(+)